MLSAHLQEWVDCRDCANDLKEVEMNLLPVMKKQWIARPIPLSLLLLTQRKRAIANASNILTMRSAVLILITGTIHHETFTTTSTPILRSTTFAPER